MLLTIPAVQHLYKHTSPVDKMREHVAEYLARDLVWSCFNRSESNNDIFPKGWTGVLTASGELERDVLRYIHQLGHKYVQHVRLGSNLRRFMDNERTKQRWKEGEKEVQGCL